MKNLEKIVDEVILKQEMTKYQSKMIRHNLLKQPTLNLFEKLIKHPHLLPTHTLNHTNEIGLNRLIEIIDSLYLKINSLDFDSCLEHKIIKNNQNLVGLITNTDLPLNSKIKLMDMFSVSDYLLNSTSKEIRILFLETKKKSKQIEFKTFWILDSCIRNEYIDFELLSVYMDEILEQKKFIEEFSETAFLKKDFLIKIDEFSIQVLMDICNIYFNDIKGFFQQNNHHMTYEKLKRIDLEIINLRKKINEELSKRNTNTAIISKILF